MDLGAYGWFEGPTAYTWLKIILQHEIREWKIINDQIGPSEQPSNLTEHWDIISFATRPPSTQYRQHALMLFRGKKLFKGWWHRKSKYSCEHINKQMSEHMSEQMSESLSSSWASHRRALEQVYWWTYEHMSIWAYEHMSIWAYEHVEGKGTSPGMLGRQIRRFSEKPATKIAIWYQALQRAFF